MSFVEADYGASEGAALVKFFSLDLQTQSWFVNLQ